MSATKKRRQGGQARRQRKVSCAVQELLDDPGAMLFLCFLYRRRRGLHWRVLYWMFRITRSSVRNPGAVRDRLLRQCLIRFVNGSTRITLTELGHKAYERTIDWYLTELPCALLILSRLAEAQTGCICSVRLELEAWNHGSYRRPAYSMSVLLLITFGLACDRGEYLAILPSGLRALERAEPTARARAAARHTEEVIHSPRRVLAI